MERVATTGLKLDLHIHSQNSRRKDGKKVKNNTLENIPVLVSKLNEQGVNICAITDQLVINKIIGNIASALGDDEAVEEMMNTNVECENTIRIIEKRITKWIDQYELPVCAGNGLYTEESPKHRIETDVLEAEYAAPLSGHSMEPDYYDGDILLIKAKGEAYDKDIVIISCEGEQYCRQYREIEGKAQYIALNKEGGSYKTIDASKAEEVVYQGKVVGVIRKVHLEDDIGKCLDDTEWEIE